MRPKRFLLFAGDVYYPGGGWDDFRGSFDTVEEAVAAMKKPPLKRYDWRHVVDVDTGEAVEGTWP